MIVTIFKSGPRTEIDFTTDFSWWYYMKPLLKDRMWRFDTLGM